MINNTDKLREAVSSILATSREEQERSRKLRELEERRKKVYYIETNGTVICIEIGKEVRIGLPPHYEMVCASSKKSTAAIRTVEQLLGVPPAKVNIKTNTKDGCLSRSNQKISKQHKQFSR